MVTFWLKQHTKCLGMRHGESCEHRARNRWDLVKTPLQGTALGPRINCQSTAAGSASPTDGTNGGYRVTVA